MSTPGSGNDTIQQKRTQRRGLGVAAAGVSLASGILQAQSDREAAGVEQTALVRQAVDRSIQVQEGFQREQAVGEVLAGESPGSAEQIQLAVQEAAGATAVDQLIINDELKAHLDSIKNQFSNRGLLVGLDALGTFLPFA